MHRLSAIKRSWATSSLGSETCLHQLSPYIGKLKSSIAQALINEFSKPGDLILEPFSGSGAVALEALRLGRNIVACDISDYAAVLTRAKLNTPRTPDEAVHSALSYIKAAKLQAKKKRHRIGAPDWVQSFFHPRTLCETKLLCDLLRADEQWFLLACVLGILHHQRPGFLSYPSSHLVPYLREKKFPKTKFPEMYEYRDVEPRLLAKIHRAYRRFSLPATALRREFLQCDVRRLHLDIQADAIITSPPYMNALDYGRDNRLRLWFIGSGDYHDVDAYNRRTVTDFSELMAQYAVVAHNHLKSSGVMVLVVGEVRRSNTTIETQSVVQRALQDSGYWKLREKVRDTVPDVRRSRRECKATKREWIMVFEKRNVL